MKRNLLRSMFAIVALLVGFVGASAQDITLPYSADFEEVTTPFGEGATLNATNTAIGSVLLVNNATATAALPYTIKANEKVTVTFTAYQGWLTSGKDVVVSLNNADGTSLVSYNYNLGNCNVTDVKIGGATATGFAAFTGQSKSSSKNANGLSNSKSQGYVADAAKNPAVTMTITGTGFVTFNFKSTNAGDKTFSGQLPAGTAINLGTMTIANPNNNEDRAIAIDNLNITSETVEMVAYTLVRKCGDTVLSSEDLAAEKGSTLSLSDAAYWVDGKKYIYTGTDYDGATMEEAGKTITMNYRAAAMWTYTLTAVDAEGAPFADLTSGQAYEGETLNIGYPAWLNNGGTLCTAPKLGDSNRGYFVEGFVLDTDNKNQNITYTATGITGIVYLSEGEKIDGMTLCTASNAGVRASNAAAAYAPNDVLFATLPNGVYKIGAVVLDATSNHTSEWSFKVNGNEAYKFAWTEVNWNEGVSEEITAPYASNNFVIAQGGNTNIGIDLVYIQKVGDVDVQERAAANIAEFKAFQNGDAVKLTLTDAKVTMASNMSMVSIVEDATGAIYFDSDLTNGMLKEQGAVDGSIINGTIPVVLSKDANGICTVALGMEEIPEGALTITAGELGAGADATITSINADPAAVALKYIKLSDVNVAVDNATGDVTLSDAEGNELPLYDKFFVWGWDGMPAYEKFVTVNGFIDYDAYGKGWTFMPYGAYEGQLKPATPAANIKALKALPDGTAAKLTLTDAKVTVKAMGHMGETVIIEDATAAINVNMGGGWYSEPTKLSEIITEVGQTFNGTLYCKYDSASCMITDADSTEFSKYEVTKTDVVPATMTLAAVADKENEFKLVKIAGAEVDAENGAITQGEKSLEMMDMLGVFAEPGTYNGNVTGFIQPDPEFDETWTNVIGWNFYFIPTAFEEVVTATIDFNAMTDEPTSSSSSTAGDITEEKMFMDEAEMVELIVSPKTAGSTENRMWGTTAGPQLRVYSGTLTLTAQENMLITGITFNQAKWNDGNTFTPASTGSDAKAWEGSAEQVVLNVAANTQINSITLTLAPAPVEEVVAENISALKAMDDQTVAKLMLTDAKVTAYEVAQTGHVAFVEDATGGIMVMCETMEYDMEEMGMKLVPTELGKFITKAGQTLNGYLYCTIDNGSTYVIQDADNTAESEVTAADATFTPTTITAAEAQTEPNIFKYVKLEGVEVNGEMLTQGETTMPYADMFAKGTPETFKGNVTGIVYGVAADWDESLEHITEWAYYMVPLTVEVIKDPVYKTFDATTVFIPTADDVAAAVEEGWVVAGTNRTDNKTLTIDPNTDEEAQTKNAPGVGLKKGNAAKSFVTYVTGISALKAYGTSGKNSEDRDIVVTATPADGGEAIVVSATSSGAKTAVAEVALDKTKQYKVEYTAVLTGSDTGADVVLHALKFIPDVADGISEINSNVEVLNGAVYNMNGVKVRNAGETLNGLKGLYIINGKKVVLK